MPLNLRKTLQRPLGQLIRADDSNFIEKITEIANQVRSFKNKIVTVGDVVSSTLLEVGVIPDIIIIDLKTKRRSLPPSKVVKCDYSVVNPAGIIKKEVWPLLTELYQKGKIPIRLYVDGEEDLLAIPATMLAPNGSIILYGQPDQGIVVLYVNNDTKQRFHNIIKAMEKLNQT
ncbi:MAG: GTP-dependent dephospho-CoA kinase family protein [Promethearchaeota archaeon]